MTINKATRSVDLFNTIRGAAVAMMSQTPESPDLQERLRKLQTTLAEYLGSAASEGILVEPDPIETEDDCTYGGGEMPRLTRAEVLHRAEQCVAASVSRTTARRRTILRRSRSFGLHTSTVRAWMRRAVCISTQPMSP